MLEDLIMVLNKAMKHLCSVSVICFVTVLTTSLLINVVKAGVPFACDVDANPWAVNFTFCDKKLGVDVRVADLVKRMTLFEKKGYMVSSAVKVPRLGLPNYEWWSEASQGVAATGFPSVILTAASFNTTLFEAIGKAVSTEARAKYNMGLAGLTYWSPIINIVRDPRWGRIRETPGEDPVLTGKYATWYVKGLQQTDDPMSDRLKVAAGCKHFAVSDIERWNGTRTYLFNPMVIKQDLEDTFLPPFKSCVVDGKVASVMCSYNQINGKPSCGDPELLTGKLRGEWNLNGYIVTDSDAIDVIANIQRHTKTAPEAVALAVKSGVDVNWGASIGQHGEAAVFNGLLEESAIDNAVTNLFKVLMRLGFFDGNPSMQPYGNLGPQDVCSPAHQELAREAARQGIVLLKNSNGSLPLSISTIKSLAIIGPNANVTQAMTGNFGGFVCKYLNPLQALSRVVPIPTIYASGCDNVQCESAQFAEATNASASADATVLFIGADHSYEEESMDRTSLSLPGKQSELVRVVADMARGPVILVIMSGGGMDVQFAKDNPKITSILWVGYPGEAGGAAIADVIFGAYNPSGRLPLSWYPESYANTVPKENMNMRPDSMTGYPGRTYRFYTGETVFQFGDGLSYTEFNYELIQAPNVLHIPVDESNQCRSSLCASLPVDAHTCQNLTFDVHFKIRNAGWVGGSHTVLLFSSPPSVHNSPKKHLVGFEKLYVHPQTEASMSMKIDVCKDLSLVDEFGARRIALGDYVLHFGDLMKHSLNIRI